jgi:hypothetical protein
MGQSFESVGIGCQEFASLMAKGSRAIKKRIMAKKHSLETYSFQIQSARRIGFSALVEIQEDLIEASAGMMEI